MFRLKRLIHEIHRHSLWQIVGIYLGGAWLAYEIIQGITEGRGLPEWLPALALVLLVIGLPFVVATAFVHEEAAPAAVEPSTPEAEAAAVQAQADARREAVGRRRFLTWRNAGLSFLVALAIWGVVAAGLLLVGGYGAAPADERRSLAVLPFENLSPDPDDAYFADGIHDEIISQLGKIASLKVISRSSNIVLLKRAAYGTDQPRRPHSSQSRSSEPVRPLRATQSGASPRRYGKTSCV